MMEYHDIIFDDSPCGDYGVHVFGGYSIPAPERDITEYTVAGRDGVLIQDNGRYRAITIPVTMIFISADESAWNDDYQRIKKWLSARNTTLVLSDDLDRFYKCYYATIKTSLRKALRYGKITVQFYCESYRYLETGTLEYDADDVLYNNYETCHPLYMITGTFTDDCTLYVNGNAMTIAAQDSALDSGQVYIDTDRQLAYDASDVISNASVSGDYTELYLEEGENTITVTSGYTVTVIPNWREL